MNWQRRLRFPRNSTSPLRSKPLTAFSVSSSRHSPRVSLLSSVVSAHKSAKFRVSKDFIKFLNAEAGKEATV